MIFSKSNNSAHVDALHCEAEGLSLLRNAIQSCEAELEIPQIYYCDENRMELEYIQSNPITDRDMARLGKGLAKIHKLTQEYYGFDTDNYIGLNRQYNGRYLNWGEFFVEKRLQPQIDMIADPNIQQEFTQKLEQSHAALENFLNKHCQHPSLLHGDLWSGNVLSSKSSVWLIDPAVYFGDREVDLAMTQMFGGFSLSFYHSYDQEFPRSEVYEQKRDIYNLYHYLNHYNLFGSSYFGGCTRGWSAIESIEESKFAGVL